MALHAGLPPLDFLVIDGDKQESCFDAFRAGIDRDYETMARVFAEVIERSVARAEEP